MDHPDIAEFCGEDFDVDEYSRKVLETTSDPSAFLAKLTQRMSALDDKLRSQIAEHHSTLLAQATSLDSGEQILEMLNQHVRTLKGNSELMYSRVADRHGKIELHTAQLERLHHTCNIVRSIARLVTLSSRLRQMTQPGAPGEEMQIKDLVKTTALVQEVAELLESDSRLTTVKVLESDIAFYERVRNTALKRAKTGLSAALANVSSGHAQLGVFMQALHNLGCLQQQLRNSFDKAHNEIAEATVRLAGAPPRGSKDADKASASQRRAQLWSNVTALVDLLLNVCMRCDVLLDVAGRKRAEQSGTVTSGDGNATFACLYNIPQTVHDFWRRVFREAIGMKLTAISGGARGVLESEYNKLLQQFLDVILRLEKFPEEVLFGVVSVRESGDDTGDGEAQQQRIPLNVACRASIELIEKAYLARSTQRLLETVKTAYSPVASTTVTKSGSASAVSNAGNILDEISVQSIASTLSAELHKARFDVILISRILKNSTQVISEFTTQAAQHIDSKEHKPINTKVANAAFTIRSAFLKLEILQSGTLDSATVSEFMRSCDALLETMKVSLDPLCSSISANLHAIFDTIHKEKYISLGEAKSNTCSAYIGELKSQYIPRVKKEVLSNLTCEDFMADRLTNEVFVRAIDRLCVNVVLVRPVDKSGLTRLAADLSGAEATLGSVASLSPSSAERLRVLSECLLSETHITEAAQEKVPLSWLLNLLVSLSPPELSSPYSTAGWSRDAYVDWMTAPGRTERERLQMVKGAVEAYTRAVQAAGQTQYAGNYSQIVSLLRGAAQKAR